VTQSETAQRQGEAEILLESGTNELEVLIFRLGEQVFGVNVAKVREVIMPVEYAAGPEQHPSIVGMFNLRGHVLPLVDLHHYLNIDPTTDNPKERKIIVTEFNGVQSGFLVEAVEHIYRMSWKNMRPVPEVDANSQFAITGITEISDRLVLMLDFESIIDHISMADGYHIDSVPNELGVDRSSMRIFLAEDSKFIRSIMVGVLSGSGYAEVNVFGNGHEAFQALVRDVDEGGPNNRIILADIEMPLMDGLALTRNIRQHAVLCHAPVVLFSSVITEDTRHKGEEVGADDQLSKPQLPELVAILDRWVDKQHQEAA